MEKIVKNLIAVAQTQLGMMEELSALLIRETGELTDINLAAMAETNKRKEYLAGSIDVHSALLAKEIEETVASEGLPLKTSLGELAQIHKQKGNSDLSRLHEELMRNADRIRRSINLNREIAERFAASVTSSLELLTRVINQSNTYGASGGYQQRAASAVMINREA